MYGMSVNAAPCVSVILTMREMSVILTQIDLLSVKLTHSLFPAAFSLGRPPLPQPFCAAQALDGRKGLLEVLEGGQVLPSYALVAVVAGLG